MKFLCDDNLGKLATYLRLLGYDTFYQATISDAQVLSTMLKEGRVVLTKDHNLASRIEPTSLVLIESDNPEQQIRQVIERLRLKSDQALLFSRCLLCNSECLNVSKDEIKERVFPYILRTKETFKKCPTCGRIYWQGSHYKDMVARLKEIFGGEIL